MNKNEFLKYVKENFKVNDTTYCLIENILEFVKNNYSSKENQTMALEELLIGSGIGLTEEDIKNITI